MSTNKKPIRWTIRSAAGEFGLHHETLAKYLRREGVQPGSDGRFSTQDICKGVFGDLRHEQTRETRERADKLALENAERRRELIRAEDVCCLTEGSFIAIRQRIIYSGLTPDEQRDLLQQLHDLMNSDLVRIGREALFRRFQERNGSGPPEEKNAA